MSRIVNLFNLGSFSLGREVSDDSPEESCASILVKADSDSLLITEVVIEGDLGVSIFPTVGMSADDFQELAESDEWKNALDWAFTFHDPSTNFRYVAFLANNGVEPNLAEEATE